MMINSIVWTRDFITNLVNSVISILRIILLSRLTGRSIKKSDQECIIIGNGTSVKGTLDYLVNNPSDKKMVCVNNFPTSTYYEKLKPSFFVTAAPEYWLEDLNDFYREMSSKLFTAMAEKTKWPLTLFIPIEAKKFRNWQLKLRDNNNIVIEFYNNTPVEGWKWLESRCFSWGLGMPRPHNALIPCIYLAINLGFKKIYLIGADHNWLPEVFVTEENRVFMNRKHFYDEKNYLVAPMAKRGKGERKLFEVLQKFVYAFKGYFILKGYAEYKKSEIFNATPNSYIDAFERVKLFDNKNHTETR